MNIRGSTKRSFFPLVGAARFVTVIVSVIVSGVCLWGPLARLIGRLERRCKDMSYTPPGFPNPTATRPLFFFGGGLVALFYYFFFCTPLDISVTIRETPTQ